ncbi:BTB/POZ domain-containing protein At5g03250-like [Zingiber officinale]|uniref:BTB/POZ domain-containing protein At5g03250-like n=1 Tax=Zingiber officinale TaxID=94328 RepID=UPI001C4CC65F|nr:BTB/POZ domain-containing protein At5g03250-like [Zingiber officinale]
MATMRLGSKPEEFQLEGQTWICKNELLSDISIKVGEVFFQLHKFPLINRSGLLHKMISEWHNDDDAKDCILELHDIPSGAKTFELVAKFCYDVRIELNSLNVVALRCASEYLEMTEHYGGGNLMMQTENFLEEVLGYWSDSMKALLTCKDALPHAEELNIVSRCINSLAGKACADPTLFSWPTDGQGSMKNVGASVLWNGIGTTGRERSPGADWWYKDVTFLDFPIYKRLILAMKSKDMKAEDIAGSLVQYANRWLPGLTRHSGSQESCNTFNSSSSLIQLESDQRVLLEQIVELLPLEKGVTSSKFLLGFLRSAIILQASPLCRENLEKRVGAQLEDATLEDLLIPNLGYSIETLYDVDCMQRILDYFISVNHPERSLTTSPCVEDEGQLIASSTALTSMTMVAKLVDGYLAEVASDVNLKIQKFQSLGALIPDYARPSDDGIYRAIDVFLKSHPWLTDSEREQLCRLMNCQKLSLEACTHAAQNERLPLRVIVQVLFFEQLRLRTTIASWFFANDNTDINPDINAPRMLPKINSRHNQEDQDFQNLSYEEMRSRVFELERECSSIREEVKKMEKPKSNWNILIGKFGHGMRLKRSGSTKK